MEEGFVTILFILLFMAASVIDAVGRKKKRQRRMDEMEAEDAGDEWAQEGQQGRGGPPVAVEDGTDRYRRASAGGESDMERYRRMDTSEPDVTPAAPDPARGQDRDRESAESMVPADLWAILTGQAPEGSAPHPDPGPRIPAPTPGDRMSRSTLEGQPPAAVEEPEAATRRSSRWMEGIEEREVSDRWTAAVEAGEAEVYRQLEEPWGKLEDISKGDLTEVSSPLSMGDDEDSLLPRGRVRGGAGTPYTRLLETGSVDDLRKAVVLKEVLDRPMALRDEIGPLR